MPHKARKNGVKYGGKTYDKDEVIPDLKFDNEFQENYWMNNFVYFEHDPVKSVKKKGDTDGGS